MKRLLSILKIKLLILKADFMFLFKFYDLPKLLLGAGVFIINFMLACLALECLFKRIGE